MIISSNDENGLAPHMHYVADFVNGTTLPLIFSHRHLSHDCLMFGMQVDTSHLWLLTFGVCSSRNVRHLL